MLKKQFNGLTAPKLRIILICSIFVLLAIGAGAFWLFRDQLVTFAKEVQLANAAASASGSDITRLQNLEKVLEDDKVAVTRAKNIVADSQSYQYQDQIINDITAYAKTSGVVITSFTFNSSTETGGGAATSPSAAGATPITPAPAGLKSTSVSITVKSPVNYKAIMNFIHSIELNLTKMQLAGISLTKSAEQSADITANPLTIEVYTR